MTFKELKKILKIITVLLYLGVILYFVIRTIYGYIIQDDDMFFADGIMAIMISVIPFGLFFVAMVFIDDEKGREKNDK